MSTRRLNGLDTLRSAAILRRELPADWDPDSPRTIAVIFAACLIGGWLLYRLVETPFMRLRRKVAPSNFAPESAPAAGVAFEGA